MPICIEIESLFWILSILLAAFTVYAITKATSIHYLVEFGWKKDHHGLFISKQPLAENLQRRYSNL